MHKQYRCDLGQACGCNPLTGCQQIPAEKWPPLDCGTQVETDLSGPIANDWTTFALASRRHGAKGVIVKHHDSHGLNYEVRHEDGTIGCYEPHELVAEEEEYRRAFKRVFEGQNLETTHVHFDGHAARSEFLRKGWNYAVDHGWFRVETVELEQDTFLKGYLTEKGKEEILKT